MSRQPNAVKLHSEVVYMTDFVFGPNLGPNRIRVLARGVVIDIGSMHRYYRVRARSIYQVEALNGIDRHWLSAFMADVHEVLPQNIKHWRDVQYKRKETNAST